MGTSALKLQEQSELAARVAANIRAEAGARRMSQSELARRLGWAMTTVNLRWTGQRDWQVSDIEEVSKIFGIDPVTLLANRYTAWDSNPEPADLSAGEAAAVGGAEVVYLPARLSVVDGSIPGREDMGI